MLQLYLGSGRVRNSSVRAVFRLCRRNFATALAQRPVWPSSHRGILCRICQAVLPCSASISTRHVYSSFPTSCTDSSSTFQRAKDLPRRQHLSLTLSPSSPSPDPNIPAFKFSDPPHYFPPRFCSRKRTCFFTTTPSSSATASIPNPFFPFLLQKLCPLPSFSYPLVCVESS